jgi:hypothetical protein
MDDCINGRLHCLSPDKDFLYAAPASHATYYGVEAPYSEFGIGSETC